MWVKRRHKVIISIARFLVKPYIKLKYRFKHSKRIKLGKGAIVLSNHTTTLDPFYISYLFKENLYFMASKDIFNHKILGKLLRWAVNPIPKEKSKKSDISAIKNCMRVIKEGGNLCIFPEGNRTFSGQLGNVDYSIVKLVKSLKVPLVICNINGGYGSDPRWGNKSRKGKLYSYVRKIYQYDEIKDMDNDDLYNLIIEGLTVDDFNYHNEYKSKRLAEDLERVFYVCPVCGQLHSIHTKGNVISCTKCGLEVVYGNNLTLTSINKQFNFKYVYQWYNWQVELLKEKEYTTSNTIYTDDMELYLSIPFKPKQLIGDGKMKMYNDRFEFSYSEGETILKFDEISAITLVGKKKMNIYVGDTTYQIFKSTKTNLLKYLHTYYVIKNKNTGGNYEFLGL